MSDDIETSSSCWCIAQAVKAGRSNGILRGKKGASGSGVSHSTNVSAGSGGGWDFDKFSLQSKSDYRFSLA